MKYLLAITALNLTMCGLMLYSVKPVEIGYSAEYRARLDEIVQNETPLSIADLGYEAE